MSRSGSGDETWFRLLNWVKGSKDAERLAAHLLRAEGYTSIDPSHPLGGPDGVKDILCLKDGKRWIGAVYFPRGQQDVKYIKQKFLNDLRGVGLNQADGVVFVTNQELRLAERSMLKEAAGEVDVELFHLERIGSLLDSPQCYGLRLEFLDIEMTKEEQLAFFASLQRHTERVQRTVLTLELLNDGKATQNHTVVRERLLDYEEGDEIHNPDYSQFGSIIDRKQSVNPKTVRRFVRHINFGIEIFPHVSNIGSHSASNVRIRINVPKPFSATEFLPDFPSDDLITVSPSLFNNISRPGQPIELIEIVEQRQDYQVRYRVDTLVHSTDETLPSFFLIFPETPELQTCEIGYSLVADQAEKTTGVLKVTLNTEHAENTKIGYHLLKRRYN